MLNQELAAMAQRDRDLWLVLQEYRAVPPSRVVRLDGAIDVLRRAIDSAHGRSLLAMEVSVAGPEGICIDTGQGPAWPEALYGARRHCFNLGTDRALAAMHGWFHNRAAWALASLPAGHPLKNTVLGRFARVM